MSRLRADIQSATGVTLGDGPIDLSSASIGRTIDGAAPIRITCPADVRGRDLARAGRYLTVWYEDDDGEIIRFGEGIINDSSVSGGRLSINGNDLLEELKYTLTMPNQTVNDLVGSAMSSLIFDAGWTVLASGTALTDSVAELFDEPKTLLNALITIAEHSGTHLRLSTTERRVIEVGSFSRANGITLIDGTTESHESDDVGIIETLSISEQAGQLANWIIPVGAEGRTIADSTRPEKQSLLGPDGQPVYYVSDQASIDEYGPRMSYETYPDLKPRSGSAADGIACANQIVVAALSTMAKRSVIRRDYRGNIRGLKTFLKPGDAVRVMYNEPVFMDDGSIWPGGAVDEYLYIIRVDVVTDGISFRQSVELSNINALREDLATDLVLAVERSKKIS